MGHLSHSRSVRVTVLEFALVGAGTEAAVSIGLGSPNGPESPGRPRAPPSSLPETIDWKRIRYS